MKKKGQKIVVQQVRSGAGSRSDQRATLRGLGLGRPGRRSELLDNPATRGMIAKVRHLIRVEGEE